MPAAPPARSRARVNNALLLTALGLFLGVWVMANPPWATVDEPAHFVRAAAVGHGDLVGRGVSPAERDHFLNPSQGAEARALKRFLGRTPRGRERGEFLLRTSRQFDVPLAIGSHVPALPCVATQPNVTGNCTNISGSLGKVSYVGVYPPTYYALVGVPTRGFSTAVAALRAARAMSALLCLLLLGFAVRTMWRSNRPNLGLLAAITPMTLYMGASVNASGLEMAAAVAFAATWLAAARTGLTRGGAVACLVTGSLLAWSRPLGALWMFAAVVLTAVFQGRQKLREFFAASRVRYLLAGLTVIAAGSIAWDIALGFGAPARHTSTGKVLSLTIDHLGALIDEQIGVFGWLDTKQPWFAYAVWMAITVAVIAVAFFVTSGRLQNVIFAVLGLYFVGLLVLAVEYAGTGFPFEGRYVLPLWAIVIIIIGQALADTPRTRTSVDAVLLGAVGVVFAFANGFAILVAARRYAVGVNGPVLFWRHAAWSPPGGWWPWLTLTILAVCLMLAWTYLGLRTLRATQEPTEVAVA